MFTKGIVVALLMSLMASSLYFFIPQVSATSSTLLGSTYYEPGGSFSGPNDPLWVGELGNDSALENLIGSYSSQAGYATYNWYGSQTTQSNIYNAASGMRAPPSISFYIGHGQYGYDSFTNNWDYSMIDNSGDWTPDWCIYLNTASMDTRFAFLWSCELGDALSSGVGMPWAWLHTSSLSSNGYSSPDTSNICFIGWNGGTPGVSLNFTQSSDGTVTSDDTFPPTGSIAYFISRFYFYALLDYQSYNINNALDQATYDTWGTPFFAYCAMYNPNGRSWFNGDFMEVYGDGSHWLESIKPLYAMKTLVNGYFYMPNWPLEQNLGLPQYIKIEEWFTNSSAEGDQIGTTVPGYLFTFPSGSVGLSDLTALAKAYNSKEGDSNWNYQMDISATRAIGLSDLTILAKNYGARSTSWYSTDLSSIKVVFNVLGNNQVTEYPDGNGFLPIPLACINWTVYQQHGWPFPDTTVGAFLTFWG